jgi:hypothetical protein
LKSKLQKEEGLGYNNLKENISKVIRYIPKKYLNNILNGAYKNRDVKYIKTNKTRKRTLKKYL